MLLRPTVCPEVKGVISKKSLEVSFFVSGNLVSNLDFVESIFGNVGNPNLAQNDTAIDTEHWTGHTGCIVLAPQLLKLTKKKLVYLILMMQQLDNVEMVCAGKMKTNCIMMVVPLKLLVKMTEV